ncbi:TetR/AcrR family transcriptional regulator [Nocardioides sp.]|uniref:TetR/AcrR family transcriptional regulator n=1 Tax=Nocardioides sp. TaxID=35761 RepID=UPI003D0E4A26
MGPTTELSPRMRQLLSAAVVVVSDSGMRGLTHRAVDRQAGLPEGSCSAYLRTRKALQTALAEYVGAHLADDVRALSKDLARCPGDHAQAAAQTAALFDRWLHGRELVTRFELSLEASRDPELAAQFSAWRTELVEVVGGILLTTGGPPDPTRAETLVVALDGVLLGAVLRPPAERAAYVRRCVALLLDALSPVEE